MTAPHDRAREVMERLLSERPPGPENALRDVKTLWRGQLRPYRGVLIGAGIMTALWSSIHFAFPLTWRFLVDDVLAGGLGVPSGQVARHVWLVGIFLMMNIVLWSARLVCHWARRRFIMGMGRGMVYELRKDLHRKLQKLHVGFFERTPVGIIMARVLDDVNFLYRWVTQQAPRGFGGLVQLLVGGALLFWLRWELALIVMGTLPIYGLVFLKLRPLVRRANRVLRRLNAKMYARSTDRIGSIAVVKAFTREQSEVRIFSTLAHDSVRVAMRLVRYNQGLSLITGVITAVTTGVIIYIGGGMIAREMTLDKGGMTIGTLSAFVGAMSMVFGAVNQLTRLATSAQGAFVVLRRVFAVLEEPEEITTGKISLDGMKGKIVFDRVAFNYPHQQVPALDDVSFVIQPGQKVALMGPSGSGKTTVFQLLLRFYDPYEGTVRVGGVDLIDVDLSSLRGHISMVEQEPTIFADTIADNIRYGKLEASREEIEQAARQAELHGFIETLPQGYDTEVGEGGVDLSGGQKQRLALATALLTDPEVLLLDDTTSALDAGTEALIRETLNHVLENRTSLIITQRVATARDCDRIIVFEDGEITQEGNHEQLKLQEGFYRDICREQDEL